MHFLKVRMTELLYQCHLCVPLKFFFSQTVDNFFTKKIKGKKKRDNNKFELLGFELALIFR
jgi:hypothetical protein